MIKGLGIDLVKIERVSNLIDKWDNRFLKKVFTGEELAYSQTRSLTPQHLAARFAAKEAALKMLGKGLKGLNWHQLEIINDSNGKPELVLHGQASELANMIGIKEIHLSITHEREYAIAQVIGEG